MTLIAILMTGLLAAPQAAKETPAQPQPFKHRVMGLFNSSREDELREAVKKLPAEITIVSIDLEMGEVVFSYDPAKVFANMKPKDYVERFNNMLRTASNHTFGISPLMTTPKEKLTKVEFTVSAPDCKGCDLAAHEYLARVEGVAQATSNLKTGKLTALFDPEKTSRAALEDVLKKRHVPVKSP